MKTKLQIIEETAAFYMEDISRRVYNAGAKRCEYITEDGRKCALGRYLIEPNRYDNSGVFNLVGLGNITQEDLKEEVRGHDWGFWFDLQRFHDWTNYWCPSGITNLGLDFLNELKEQYATA